MSLGALTVADRARALVVVVIWGLNFVAMKYALQDMGPMLLGALRFALASLPFLWWVGRPRLPWRFVVGYGLAQGLGQFGCLFLGLQLGMTAGMASVVMQAQAFFTLLLAVPVLGERARPAQVLGLLVASAGLLTIAMAHGQGAGQMTLIGFVLTLGAAFMWAVSNLVARLASRVADYEPFPFIVWSSLVPILPFTALAVWQDSWAGVASQWAAIGPLTVASLLFLAWLATLLAYSLWTRLLKRHPANRVTPFSLLVPVVGLWAAWFFVGEHPAPLQWLGTAAVVLGLVINQIGPRWGGRS